MRQVAGGYWVSDDPEDALVVGPVTVTTKAKLRTVLYADNVVVGESFDPALWTRNMGFMVNEKPACPECAGDVDSQGYCDPCATRAVEAECKARGITREQYIVDILLADRPDALKAE